MSLSPQFLDELRARTTLSTLIGRSVKLQKAGREYRACCPFHNEKSPSFYVNDEKGFYHCFGCSAHGDAIRWMTDQQGLPFMDAVKELAATAGMEVPAPDPRAQERQARGAGLIDAMEAAADFFEAQLGGLDGAQARAYLEQRGVGDAQRRTFRIGYSPESRTRLKMALRDFGPEKLIEAGLLISVDEKEPYDRFRGRLMIPIRDPRGRTIAFGGRILDTGEPKYLNSPDTPLFDKGRTLFNLDRAGPAARKSGRIIVVEGYMDVIALDGAGISEAVAPLGTALTEAQIERLWSIVDVPLLCFDGDAAGQKAAVRAAHRALPMLAPGKSLRFAMLPPGQDPDDVIRAGGAPAFEELLRSGQPLVERLWLHERESAPLGTPEERAGLRKRLGALVETIANGDVRHQYMLEFRRRFDVMMAPPVRPSRPAPRSGAPRYRANPADGRRRWDPPQPSSEAKAIGGGGIDRMMIQAIICGLIRYPDRIRAHLEAFGALPITDRKLDHARSMLIETVLTKQVLEPKELEAILIEAGEGDVMERIAGTNGLAFSFLRSNAETEQAKRDLDEAICLLATRPALAHSLNEATRKFEIDTVDDAYVEQQRLSRALHDVDMKLRLLASGDVDRA